MSSVARCAIAIAAWCRQRGARGREPHHAAGGAEQPERRERKQAVMADQDVEGIDGGDGSPRSMPREFLGRPVRAGVVVPVVPAAGREFRRAVALRRPLQGQLASASARPTAPSGRRGMRCSMIGWSEMSMLCSRSCGDQLRRRDAVVRAARPNASASVAMTGPSWRWA